MQLPPFGMILGAAFLVFFVLLIPSIIRGAKKSKQNKIRAKQEQDDRERVAKTIAELALEQQKTITDASLKKCWQLFIVAISSWQQPYGNYITKADIEKYIKLLERKEIENWEGFGQETLYITIISAETVEVVYASGSDKAECNITLLLQEFRKLQERMAANGIS